MYSMFLYNETPKILDLEQYLTISHQQQEFIRREVVIAEGTFW